MVTFFLIVAAASNPQLNFKFVFNSLQDCKQAQTQAKADKELLLKQGCTEEKKEQ